MAFVSRPEPIRAADSRAAVAVSVGPKAADNSIRPNRGCTVLGVVLGALTNAGGGEGPDYLELGPGLSRLGTTATVRNCGSLAFSQGSEDGVGPIRAVGTSCKPRGGWRGPSGR